MKSARDDAYDRVCRALDDLHSITNDTVQLLKSLLDVDVNVDPEAQKPAIAALSTRAPPRRPQAKTGSVSRSARAAKTVKFDIHESPQSHIAALESKERKKLATRCFNTTVKDLSDVARTKLQDLAASPSSPRHTNVKPPHPLEDIAINRGSKKTTNSKTRASVKDLLAISKCTAVALESLRRLSEDETGPDSVNIGLENGGLALLDKAITLGLCEVAEEQSIRLHDQYWKRKHLERPHRDLASRLCLLREQNTADFKFTTTLQSQNLRLAILQGGTVLNDGFTSHLYLGKEGSPAWNLINGFSDSLIGSEECGNNLRTVSLALSKLHAVCEKSCPEDLHHETMRLATVALQIKCMSWKYMGHQPDLPRELWAPVSKLLKRKVTTATLQNQQRQTAGGCLMLLQTTLQQCGFDEDPPPSLQSYCGTTDRPKSARPQPAVDHGDINNDEAGKLELSLPALDSWRGEPSSAISAADRCTKIVISMSDDTLSQSPTLLMMTRLRKVLITAIQDLEKIDELDDGKQELQIALLQTVFAIVSALHRSVTSPDTSTQPEKALVAEKGKLLALAKTIEAILQLDLVRATREVIYSQMHATLVTCVSLAQSVRNETNIEGVSESTRDFLGTVTLRVSHLFWNRYLAFTQQARPRAHRIETLYLAIQVMKDAAPLQRKTAVLTLKLEKLAELYIAEKMYGQAQASIEAALLLHVEHDDAIMAAHNLKLDVPGPHGGESLECFQQSLKMYIQLSLVHSLSSPRGLWYYDDTGQPDSLRALMLQEQIMLAIQNNMEVSLTQLSACVQLWEQLCNAKEYQSYRVRSLSQLIHTMAHNKRFEVIDLLSPLQTIIAVRSSSVRAVEGATSLPLLHQIINIQLDLIEDVVDEAKLSSYTKGLQQIGEKYGQAGYKTSEKSFSVVRSQVKTLIDVAGVYGLAPIQLQLHDVDELLLNAQSRECSHQSRLTRYIDVARLHLDTDNTVAAGKILAETEESTRKQDICSIEWLLVNAEYHCAIGNDEKVKELIHAAGLELKKQRAEDRLKLDESLQLCRAAHLASQLSRREGNLTEASIFARQAVKITSALWGTLESSIKAEATPTLNGNESSLQNVTQDMSNLTLQDATHQNATLHLHGAKYWKLISVNRSSLRWLADLYSHNGLYQEAMFYAQHAAKLTSRTGGRALRSAVNSELALIHAQAFDNEKVPTLLAREVSDLNYEDTQDYQRTLLNHAEALMHLNDSQHAVAFFNDVRKESLVATSVAGKPHVQPPASTTRSKTTKAPVKARVKTAPKVVAKKPALPQRIELLSTSARALRARVAVIECQLALAGILKSPETMLRDVPHLMPAEILAKALVFAQNAIKKLATDPSSNAICETTLALPVRYQRVRKSGQMSILLEQSPAKPGSSFATSSERDSLTGAYEWLRMIDSSRLPLLSSPMVATLCKALSQVILLSTTAEKPFNYSPLNVVLQSLRPTNVTRRRERSAIIAERDTASRLMLEKWPSLHEVENEDEDFSDFVKKLPKSWTIVSIGLSHDSRELLLSKINAQTTPFLMRVPLERPGLEDDEPCEFTLEYARNEIKTIIEQANHSSHDPRSHGAKEARREWYTGREKLDRRLELFLINIENIWLGGFRGLLSPTVSDPELLFRFGENLTLAFDSHLPSRQKKSKPKQKIELHAHVLELFTSIPFRESSTDYEDSITDLLYFVVDILQFNGEPNAFDEIDFDALLLETINALRHYHFIQPASTPTQHTILILDKELQSIPWESLPCLIGHPVSRMPSLGAIAERLDRILAFQPAASADTYQIPASAHSQGAYILNPGADLPTTQTHLEPVLTTQLPQYNATVGHAPSESQFLDILMRNQILLYFGHGAGTQYIRGRQIRSCFINSGSRTPLAVTWLMGCSSAVLKECGVYESYGVPWHYMHGGSMAMVGTLWDVTDRDVDRFAVRGLDLWGLLEGTDEVMQEGFWGTKKQREMLKERVRERETNRSTVDAFRASRKAKKSKETHQTEESDSEDLGTRKKLPLDEAVAKARDACLLRYLNGAAPVVYGLPVSLGD